MRDLTISVYCVKYEKDTSPLCLSGIAEYESDSEFLSLMAATTRRMISGAALVPVIAGPLKTEQEIQETAVTAVTIKTERNLNTDRSLSLI